MLKIFLILITSVLFTTNYSSGIKRNNTQFCLLIKCDIENKTDIIKFQGLQKNKFKYFFTPEVGVDDFSVYDPEKKIFNVDGDLKLKDSARIMFWNYDNKIGISTLPFNYALISIDSLVNDSTILVSFNKSRHIINSGEIFKDSIISIKKEHRRLIKHTTIYRIENIGLINKENIIDNKFRVDRKTKVLEDEYNEINKNQ